MQKKILILTASPTNRARLRLDREVRDIQEGLRLSEHRDRFQVTSQWATRLRDLRRAMLREKPEIVHFCGHGEKESSVMFEDENGAALVFPVDALANFFKLFAGHVEGVLLNACYSETQAGAIAGHIGFVIGMPHTIRDKSAVEFAVAFYDTLGAGESVEFAYNIGCNALELLGVPNAELPVLSGKSATPQPDVRESAPDKVHQPPPATDQNMDLRVLSALYAYYRQNPGMPKMNFHALSQAAQVTDAAALHETLLSLKEKGWLDGVFLEGGQAGLIWIRPEGIAVAKQLN
ncbi:MAG: CHAT domain-containing protein [bacterium]|nr:CHAT domain-containing protein [bacterium]